MVLGSNRGSLFLPKPCSEPIDAARVWPKIPVITLYPPPVYLGLYFARGKPSPTPTRIAETRAGKPATGEGVATPPHFRQTEPVRRRSGMNLRCIPVLLEQGGGRAMCCLTLPPGSHGFFGLVK